MTKQGVTHVDLPPCGILLCPLPYPALVQDYSIVGAHVALSGRDVYVWGAGHRCSWVRCHLHTGGCPLGRVSRLGWVVGETPVFQACPTSHLGSENTLAYPDSPFPGCQPGVWDSW